MPKLFSRKILRPIRNQLRYGDSDFDPVEHLVFEDRGLVLLVISKVACTSIKATIGKSYDIKFKKRSGLDIHNHKFWTRCFGKLPEKYASFYTAIFVRNPFSRLVSCYKDRVIYEAGHQNFSRYYFEKYPFTIPVNCPFPSFVEFVSEVPDKWADRHFKAQSYILSKLNKEPDFVGRFETISEDWQSLAKRFQFDETLTHLNSSNRQNKKLEKDYRKYFDQNTLELVGQRYADDINQFAYNNMQSDLKSFVEESR